MTYEELVCPSFDDTVSALDWSHLSARGHELFRHACPVGCGGRGGVGLISACRGFRRRDDVR